MNDTEHEGRRVLLGGYVLGGLSAAEREEVQAHLEGCPACRAELVELEALPDLLELARSDTPRPADDLRQRVLATAPVAPSVRPSAAYRLATVAAAVALLAGGVIGAGVTRAADRPPDLVVTLMPVEGTQGVGEARLEDTPTGVRVRLTVDGLPALAPGETYQAWLSDGRARTTAGSFQTARGQGVELELTAAGGIDEYQAFGISAVSGPGANRAARDVVLGELSG